MVDKKLLDILACPACRSSIEVKGNFICCVGCKKKYPIKNDIPIMLIEEAVE